MYPLLSWVTLGENWCSSHPDGPDRPRGGPRSAGPEGPRSSGCGPSAVLPREALLTGPSLGVRKTRTNATEEPCSSCIRAAHALPDELPE